MGATSMKLKSIAMVVGVVAMASAVGCLSCSHGQYAKRAEAAQTLPRGPAAHGQLWRRD